MNNIVTEIGEDALPFANSSGMFVADGLSSRGVRVISFAPDCFDKDSLVQVIFRHEMVQELPISLHLQFEKYIRESFSSLANSTMENMYKLPLKNILRLKNSGYVGSHALGVTLVYYLLNLSAMGKTLSSEQWKETILAYRERLVTDYKKTIDLIGCECAKTTITKMDSMNYGTTLSAAFFKETETNIEVFFFNSGDSRSYILGCHGFRQAADDQGRNGRKTDYISYNSSANSVHNEIKIYSKPCILFCMTDGIYDFFSGKQGFASSPLRMEGYLLNCIINLRSFSELRSSLQALFDNKGTNDDSNSMAITFVGFNDYDEVKAFAKQRMNKLSKKYTLDILPDDFFAVDYSKVEKYSNTSLALKQKEIFEDYLKEHLSELGDEKYNDAFKNGWIN